MRVLVCAAACVAGCGLPGSSQPPTASQVLATRLAAFTAAKTVTMIGHVSYGDVTYPVSLQVDDQGQASGTVELDHVLVSAMIAGGRTFLKNSNYYTGKQLATGDQWVLERAGVVVDLLAKLADRKGLAAAMLAAAGSSVGRVASPDVSGVKVFRLANPDFSATVPTAGGPPVRLVTGVDTSLSNGFTDVRLTLSDYGLAANIAAPGAFLDRSQPDTWPAHFAAVIAPDTPFTFDECNSSGCTLSASFKNTGGKVGTATATFYVFVSGSTAGSCDVPVPTTGNGTVVRAGCRVSYNGYQQASGNVKIQNPQ